MNKELLERFNNSLSTSIVGRPTNDTNEYWDTIDSTNTRMAELVKGGAKEGTTVIARKQTAGRGRLGRTWESPQDSGLYLSTLLKPDKKLFELPVITLCLGVAVRRAVLATCGVELELKWVNDLIYNTRKAAGILVEVPVSGAPKISGSTLVVGVGVNLNRPEGPLPEEIKKKAIYLNEVSEATIDTIQLASELCFQFEAVYKNLKADRFELLLDEWRAHSCTLGQKVTTSNGEIEGLAVDINETGALIVKTETGNKTVHAGEISVRSADGSYSY